MSERSSILARLVEIASAAAEIVREVYATEFVVDYKQPRDPVTSADRRANELICQRLAEAFPGWPVVAEESDPQTFERFREHERVFFVDPLDGTREFVKRNGEFAVMIGLLERDRPSVGVIHAPARGVCVTGIVGEGAGLTTEAGEKSEIRVSAQDVLSEARVVASRSHRSQLLEQALAFLGVKSLEQLGSAGLKCAEVGRGLAEAYLAPGRAGHRWDVCAGEAIVVAAGGRVTDAKGDSIDYRAESLANATGLVISNGTLHDALLERLRQLPDPGK